MEQELAAKSAEKGDADADEEVKDDKNPINQNTSK